jgi:homoserine O-acetyltransferase
VREYDVPIGPLPLDCGQTLGDVVQRVTVYGNDEAGRTALVCHALTGSSRAAEWWPGIAGADGALFDTAQWRVVGINALGSCYGSTGPRPGEPFPRVGVGDIVRAQRRALDELGIEKIDVAIGGSLGGMQALQWAVDAPYRVGHAIAIGSHDHQGAMGIALNAVQRDALGLDPVRGLRLARKIAMLSYKSDDLLNQRHGRKRDRNGADRFDVEGYLERQADIFETRMDAASYAALTHAMDAFDVRSAQAPGNVNAAAHLTFVGIESDWLFRPHDVRAAAERFAARGFRSRYLTFPSAHGHDAFLAESQTLATLLGPYVDLDHALHHPQQPLQRVLHSDLHGRFR